MSVQVFLFKTIASSSIVKKKSWVKTWRLVTSPPWPLPHVLGRLPTSVSSTCLNSLDRFKIIVLFMRIDYILIILCTSVSYIRFNTSTVWTGCNSSNPVRKSSSTSNHHCSHVQVYPAFGPGKEFHLDWMALIVARNLIATWVICGFWDWFLYFSPLQVGHCSIWEMPPSPYMCFCICLL